MNGDKPSDETPLSPQWLSLAPQRSTGSSLLESTGPIQSALLSDNSKVSSKTTMGPFASRTLSTSRSLSSQWGSGEGRKPAGSASLPSDLLFPSAPGGEPYWNEGKSVGRASDSGWHSKKKADSASFDPGSGSGSLYSPLGSGRGTLGGRPTSKPREISRGGWGYSSGDAPRSPRSGVVRRESFNNEQANRGSFSGSYGTSQEGYENFKQSSSIDKKHQLSSSGERKSERWDRWNNSDGSWRSKGGHSSTQQLQRGFSIFTSRGGGGMDNHESPPQHFASSRGRSAFGGRGVTVEGDGSRRGSGASRGSFGGASTVLADINHPPSHRYSRSFMYDVLNDLMSQYSFLPLPDGADLDDVGSCETPQVKQHQEEQEEVPEWAKDDSSLPKPGSGAIDFTGLGSFELNADELWKDISVDVEKSSVNRASLLQGLLDPMKSMQAPVQAPVQTPVQTPVQPPMQPQAQEPIQVQPLPKPQPATRYEDHLGNGNAILDQWIYKDPNGNVQGPFNTSQMLEWYQAKFFPLHLPVASYAGNVLEAVFQPLSLWLGKWGSQLDPSPVQQSSLGAPLAGSFNEQTFQSSKQGSLYMGRGEALSLEQQFIQAPAVQGMHSQSMRLQQEVAIQAQMQPQSMMYSQNLSGSQMPFTESVPMAESGLGVQPIPMDHPKSQQQQEQMYDQFSSVRIVASQDSQIAQAQEAAPQSLPPMPAMPAMPVGVASLEQIEARMRDHPSVSDLPMNIPIAQEQTAMPGPPQKFWGDLPESKVSMADIMNEETEKAKKAMKVIKPQVISRRIEPLPGPQPDIISAGKSNWAELPSKGPSTTKSLAEILEEEEMMRAMNQANRSVQQVSENSWAAKLGGSNVYSGPDASIHVVDRAEIGGNRQSS